jgi:hypothetical protein
MRQNLVHQLMKADVQIVEAQSVGEDPCLKLQKLKVSMDGNVVSDILSCQTPEAPPLRPLPHHHHLTITPSTPLHHDLILLALINLLSSLQD